MQNFISVFIIISCLAAKLSAQTYSKETIRIETTYGTMKIKLFEETPLHKANFLKLANEHFFDSLLFHRVINNFMIQGGDPTSKYAKANDTLGNGEIGYTIPAEFNPALIHKKGRLCAARESDDINPKKESSACQFYIVMGKKRTPEDLKKIEERINKTHYTNCAAAFMKTEDGKKLKQNYNRLKTENKTDSAALVNAEIEDHIKTGHLKTSEYKFSKEQIDVYTTVGGTPHLDGTYTVFGEVTEGLDVIDKISAVKTNKLDRPLEDIRMKVTIEK